MLKADVAVSVICLAYNHEKYIRDCLEGIVSQKTDFLYELIVHDDASTDNTADIIREYVCRYPDIIKPIYQTQNQYSKRVSIVKEFVLPMICGKFIAFCEGDDYWTDPYKLQKQVDGMIQHPSCSMCTHKVIEIYEDGTPNGKCFPDASVDAGVLSTREFYEIGKQYSFHTSSYILRADQYREYQLNPPEFVKKSDVGDEVMMLYFGMQGEVLYLSDEMSCYRRGAAVSWSSKNYRDINKMISHGHRMIDTFKSFDVYAEKKYHDILCDRIARQMAKTLILEKKTCVFLRKENREYFRYLSFVRKAFVLIGVVMPGCMRRIYIQRINELTADRGVF